MNEYLTHDICANNKIWNAYNGSGAERGVGVIQVGLLCVCIVKT